MCNLLNEIPDPPRGLYYQGNKALLEQPCVSVVGSRVPTTETIQTLRVIVPRLVELGFTIVSGCALGVDSIVHQLTMQAGGQCIGVLGYGSDIRYPRQVAHIIDVIAEKHLLISEYEPATPIRKFQFIARNRIIAGLSSTTIIAQAAAQSGSLITATMALEYNRDILVVPGSGFSPAFEGSHALILEGAEILFSPTQLKKRVDIF